ncbi:symmetrical bis(5'-nucleosyl)-tetraphosphatase [Sulfuricystis multivorans]|uniref:symmetrical bis(5'-nucleosyl)-tetraphosphatase n=1 Tax=Sulfuricystis multivorans TaxID=2211108 RepID=UPI000F82E7BF|nr:symmetrical bis(5'-nucleosyl)-tetraphosphatase [Sulfuricystis multivorans]
MATYAIGDVQGCFEPLERLLDYLRFSPASDRLWFVGDLVNRGPASLEVLRFVKALNDAATIVLGNHDLHLVMQAEGFGKASREDTLDAVLTAPDREELIAWLRSRPLFHVEGEWAMVHAGLLPCWDVAKAQALSDEVSAALTASDYREFLAHMWGSEPDAWRDDLCGWDRLRVVVNAMTRMRFVTPEGRMEFRAAGAKGPPERGPAGTLPWFAVPGRKSADHHIVFGHWSALGFRQMDNVLALDSGCLWGGSLTAVRLEDRRVFQMPCGQAAKPTGWQ